METTIEGLEKQLESIRQDMEIFTEQTTSNMHQLDNSIKEYKEQEEFTHGDMYYYIDGSGGLLVTKLQQGAFWEGLISMGNLFETTEQAKSKIAFIKTCHKVSKIAKRLNNGRKIDWSNFGQKKHYIYYDMEHVSVDYDTYYGVKNSGIYCLDEKFLAVCLKEIGEGALRDYLMYEI